MSYTILPFTVMNNLTLWPWNLSQVGSLSPSSSGSYPTRAFGSSRPQPATHPLSSVVLPKPAGAEIRVSLRWMPAFSRSIRRGRGTSSGRTGGIWSLVCKSGVDTCFAPGVPQVTLRRLYHWPDQGTTETYAACVPLTPGTIVALERVLRNYSGWEE